MLGEQSFQLGGDSSVREGAKIAIPVMKRDWIYHEYGSFGVGLALRMC